MALTFEEQRTNAEKIADAEVRERVLRGIDVLRQEYGDDWTDHVDAVVLRCVLGQLETYRSGDGNYYSMALVLIDGLVEDSPEEYGFNATGVSEYGDLTQAWRTVLGAVA